MDLKLIRNLVRLMERGELTELEIDDERAGLRLHLKRGQEGGGHHTGPVVMVPGAAAPVALPLSPMDHGAGAEDDASAGREGLVEITSPMVGTFYRSGSPEADPFVAKGTQLDDDFTICIIEAMKVMNEIKAERTGEVVDILVENGEPVEFGQPLFLVKP